ncbi:damage-inducible protein DinB [Martelella alba]|uniref:Damage-inducible protein DinB n=1 Tax=Martelella alba TaxID=2590451 RepID=A0A506U7J0_9HYPH|nr:DinB family protein [Martelella alba]TPW29830.1 damage-inducible protein DinB [Martelella alba]
MLSHFRMFAAYNNWANSLVYSSASHLAYDDYTRDLGAFFHSVHGTLNHLLFTDRIWMKRFAGEYTGSVKLDSIVSDDFEDLRLAREVEDQAIIAYIDSLSEAQLAGRFSYMRGNPPEQYNDSISKALAHLFNHQTHHRGQIHMMLTTLGRPSLEMDLIYFLRSDAGRPFA